jgi:hypothetical protein
MSHETGPVVRRADRHLDGTAGTVHQVSAPVGSAAVCEEVLNRKRLFTSGLTWLTIPFDVHRPCKA